MLQTAQAIDFRQILVFGGVFGPREIDQICWGISSDPHNLRFFREAVRQLEASEDESPALNVRLGVSLYLLGEYRRALEVLKKGDNGALAWFYRGQALMGLGQFQEAVEAFDTAARAGFDQDRCHLAAVEALRQAGKLAEAQARLELVSPQGRQSAEYLYQKACNLRHLSGDPAEIISLLEQAVAVDPHHPGALFGLALECDRYGNDEEAFELYERAASRFPPHVGALLNLGLIYEDRGQLDKAVECYKRVLDAYPNNERARLFLKDVEGARDQYEDEEIRGRHDKLEQLFRIPVSDFELSVRARNCLQRMGIVTLGDLCRCTEQELLASKNFGETSLQEIKEMLASKGLRLGMLAGEKRPPAWLDISSLTPDQQALLNRPVSDLNLSVRARKCMARLGINTLGDLIRYSADELLECKNFGVTSLNEVRDKLASLGLKLRGE
ncbi:MAG: tetratricopeptide repeat protein [Thermoguttaceae bacterium]|nr:tetratricopeptide repeat protein [Thermoguttaceae bacterium]MDW8077392.1 DNA-directed RNA polymerase subunit alpha C-terminal domain-containing protein [Thermoguttaceae bacterium]